MRNSRADAVASAESAAMWAPSRMPKVRAQDLRCLRGISGLTDGRIGGAGFGITSGMTNAGHQWSNTSYMRQHNFQLCSTLFYGCPTSALLEQQICSIVVLLLLYCRSTDAQTWADPSEHHISLHTSNLAMSSRVWFCSTFVLHLFYIFSTSVLPMAQGSERRACRWGGAVSGGVRDLAPA